MNVSSIDPETVMAIVSQAINNGRRSVQLSSQDSVHGGDTDHSTCRVVSPTDTSTGSQRNRLASEMLQGESSNPASGSKDPRRNRGPNDRSGGSEPRTGFEREDALRSDTNERTGGRSKKDAPSNRGRGRRGCATNRSAAQPRDGLYRSPTRSQNESRNHHRYNQDQSTPIYRDTTRSERAPDRSTRNRSKKGTTRSDCAPNQSTSEQVLASTAAVERSGIPEFNNRVDDGRNYLPKHKDTTNDPNKRPRRRKRCFNCGSTSHLARKCRMKEDQMSLQAEVTNDVSEQFLQGYEDREQQHYLSQNEQETGENLDDLPEYTKPEFLDNKEWQQYLSQNGCLMCETLEHTTNVCPQLPSVFVEEWRMGVINEEDEEPEEYFDALPGYMDCNAITMGRAFTRTEGWKCGTSPMPETEEIMTQIKALPTKERTTFLNQMFTAIKNALKVDFTFRTVQKTKQERALLDSEASENFINIETWRTLGIGRVKLSNPIPVHNVDGTENKRGAIEYYCWLKVKIGKEMRRMRFYLTGLGKEHFILGYPFLRGFNPTVNWAEGQLKDKVEIETLPYKKIQEVVRKVQRQAFRKHGRPKEGQALYLRKTTTAQEWAHRARKGKQKAEGLLEIPQEYQRHWKVFNEERAERFPPQREEDMKIELLPNAPTSINCKVYPLNQKEEGILREFLAEEQRKGYIKMGSSPYTSPVFFVGKKDSDELRPVMDYRKINDWTKKDNNALPNIRTALENLQGGEIYSKFDIRWGYKNLRIRPEDRPKATFKTTQGTFIPNVTYFGLTNAPPTFQRIMSRDLQRLLQKYPRNFGNYLDDTWIVTAKNPEGREKHRQITHELLDLLEKKSYFLKLSKCEFEVEDMELLGWRVCNGEIRIDPSKIAGLRDWPKVLKNKKDIQKTMGILNYLRPVIRGFSKIAKPIMEL